MKRDQSLYTENCLYRGKKLKKKQTRRIYHVLRLEDYY